MPPFTKTSGRLRGKYWFTRQPKIVDFLQLGHLQLAPPLQVQATCCPLGGCVLARCALVPCALARCVLTRCACWRAARWPAVCCVLAMEQQGCMNNLTNNGPMLCLDISEFATGFVHAETNQFTQSLWREPNHLRLT